MTTKQRQYIAELEFDKVLLELTNAVLEIENKALMQQPYTLSQIRDDFADDDILEEFSEYELKKYVMNNFYAEDWIEEIRIDWNY